MRRQRGGGSKKLARKGLDYGVLVLAEKLGKFEHEVAELSPDEFARWIAFFNLRRKEEQQANRHQTRR